MKAKVSSLWRFAGIVIAGVGVAHFADPRSLEPLTKLAFPRRTRLHVYVNGALETGIGILINRRPTRVAGTIALIGYSIYLAGNTARTILSRAGSGYRARTSGRRPHIHTPPAISVADHNAADLLH